MTDFDGLVAVVTGGASGIGKATAELLESRGATVSVLDLATGCDVGDSASVNAAVAATMDRYGRLDVLINNAGIQKPAASHEIEAADFDRILAVNLRGPFLCSREAIRHFLSNLSRLIIAISAAAHSEAAAKQRGDRDEHFNQQNLAPHRRCRLRGYDGFCIHRAGW